MRDPAMIKGYSEDIEKILVLLTHEKTTGFLTASNNTVKTTFPYLIHKLSSIKDFTQ